MADSKVPVWAWLLAGGGLLAYLATRAPSDPDATTDSTMEADEEDGVEDDSETAGADSVLPGVPAAAAAYSDLIRAAGAQYGVDPLILAAIGWRETCWGTGPGLDAKDPTGTGDHTLRSLRWLKNKGVVQTNVIPAGWKGSGAGPWSMPGDGRGWGRGLMQLDYDLAQSVAWDDAETNINQAAKLWAAKKKIIQGKYPGLPDDEYSIAATAAYNCGEGNVTKLLAGTHPSFPGRSYQTDGIFVVDLSTTGQNYAKTAVNNVMKWSAAASALTS